MSSEIYFWEGAVSPHKIPLLNALARRPEVRRAVYVAQGRLNYKVVSTGVPNDHVPDCELIMAPDAAKVASIIAASAPDSVHLFSGMHWVPCITEGIRQAALQNRCFGIMSEPRVLEGVKGKLRLLHSWTQERTHRRHAAFVAAIGRHGPRWFHLTGYGDRVFPFAYFIDPPKLAARDETPPDQRRLRIGYIGRLVEAKGFGVFLKMIEAANGRYDFVIAGSGAMAPEAQAAAAKHPNVSFHGVMPMAEVPSLMAGLDCLVVPSLTTDDGWAVVVTESLFAGTLPIIGGRVGASVLAEDDKIARRVDSDDPRAYLAAIEAASHALTGPDRSARTAYAHAHLSAEAGADYLIRMLRHLRNGAPRPRDFYSAAPVQITPAPTELAPRPGDVPAQPSGL